MLENGNASLMKQYMYDKLRCFEIIHRHAVSYFTRGMNENCLVSRLSDILEWVNIHAQQDA